MRLECCWQAVRCREGWTWQEGEENRCKEDKTAQVIRERYKRFMVAEQIAKERGKESNVVSDITHSLHTFHCTYRRWCAGKVLDRLREQRAMW